MISFKRFGALLLSLHCILCTPFAQAHDKPENELSVHIVKKYLNLPISHQVQRKKMSFDLDGDPQLEFVIRLAPDTPDYWVFHDLSAWMGQKLTIKYEGDPKGLHHMYQSDEIDGDSDLYKEINRPQVHFTSRRGWINDPNGMVYHDGEYHLYYQHNPFEREWENMSWGHAVSKNLTHWEELPIVMFPDHLGTIFSGSAVIDHQNSSGFGKDGIPPLVAFYTVFNPENQRQCIAYSLDNGRTFTKYEGNPVIDSKEKWNSVDLRDPHVFWHEPTNEWVMALFERDGHSIYTSRNLRDWHYESHVSGFWECPQLFKLPVDGKKNATKWVMYGASGTYLIGTFDGKCFTPENGKYCYGNGAIYAAQTFNNMPASDPRRIQIGWGRIQQDGMPFNNMMLFPTELTLKTTKEGIRMFNNPIEELENLHKEEFSCKESDLDATTHFLQQFKNDTALRVKMTIRLSHATDAGLNLFGQTIFRYDMNSNLINGMFYSPEDPTSMEISVDMILDKTSVEVFVDGGAFSYAFERKAHDGNTDGFAFFGNRIEVINLNVYRLQSIWN